MPEGFGNLAGLLKLNMKNCRSLGSLPDSESRHSESFYFLIFDVQRLWTSQQPEGAHPASVWSPGVTPRQWVPNDFSFLISNFGNLISEGFGDLSNLETLNLRMCKKLELLPASKSRPSGSFNFLIFILLWRSLLFLKLLIGVLFWLVCDLLVFREIGVSFAIFLFFDRLRLLFFLTVFVFVDLVTSFLELVFLASVFFVATFLDSLFKSACWFCASLRIFSASSLEISFLFDFPFCFIEFKIFSS